MVDNEVPSDPQTRSLSVRERLVLLNQPLVGVLSTLDPRGWIHSVPVHFFVDGDDLRIVMGKESVKCRNARRSGRATLCVETSTSVERRYVSAEGRVRVEAVSLRDLVAFDKKYARADAAGFEEGVFDQDVTLILRPERWIARTDWDE